MIFPRLTALSETLWSSKSLRNWDDFSERLKNIFKRYEFLDINYAKSAYTITSNIKTDLKSKSVALTLQNEFSKSDIRYVLNDGNLNANAIKFIEPIRLHKTTFIKASVFENDKPVGTVFKDTITFHNAVSSKVDYKTNCHERYQGSGVFNLVNTLRGTKNFRDGRWQAWLNKEADITINFENEEYIKEVVIGSMENQQNGIFYPNKIQILTSIDGKNFKEVKSFTRKYAQNNEPELKDFKFEFEAQKAKFIKVKVNLSENSKNRNEGWIFIDEILIN